MKFTIRTTPVAVGTKPYNWSADCDSIYQCTWYAYYRALEAGMTPPCYWDRETRKGSYTNAKDWLANFREPWVVKGLDYIPVAGDIVVWNGNYGHVAFIEEMINPSTALISQYKSGKKDSFSNYQWKVGTSYTGTLLGYLHYDTISPVARNTKVNQVKVNDDSLRVRTNPNLQGTIIGYAPVGYYNVISSSNADGYTWYQIEKGKYIANVSTKYYPASEDSSSGDIINVIKRFAEDMQDRVDTLNTENKELIDKLVKIHELSSVK